MRCRRSLVSIAVSVALLAGPSLFAQTSQIAPRIVRSIDETHLVPLKGNVTAAARPQFDQGEADPATRMTYVRLVLSRSQEQEAALEQFMAQQLDKSSPNYHHWLTPQQFGRLYGPADSDIAAIVAWLQSRGLTVEPVPPGRNNIAFSGSVSQIEEAFHTQIHSFHLNGEQFYSNISDPKIPAALAPVVAGVAGLNTLRPRSHAVKGPAGMYDPRVGRVVPSSPNEGRAQAEFTPSGYNFLYVVAGDAATIYDTPNSLNANFSSGTSYTGRGVTIGIGGEALIKPATVQNYRSLFIGDTTAPTITNVVPASTYNANNGALDEAYLDTEISGALAPGATIHFYVSTNLNNAIQQAISDNTVDIFSLSFGLCEMDLTTAQNQLLNGYWQQFAAQGVAVAVSTGDSGAAGCDDQNTETVATQGLQVSGFSTTPYNIAVGGSDYYGLHSGFASYVSATNGATYRSALKYIPESTWNDSVQSDGLLSANVPSLDSKSNSNIVGGTGGASSCSTNTTTVVSGNINAGTCNSGYAKPAWQRGAGVPNDKVRDVPDVALLSGNGFDGATWLVCTDDLDSNNNNTPENCTLSNGSFDNSGFGGTSASTPAFAGILALVQEKMGGGGQAHRLGLDGAKALYDLYTGPHSSAIFHDITQGNNSVPCTSGTPDCSQNTAGNYFLKGYDTTTGYDLATGLGSVDATQLITYWGGSTGSGSSRLTVTPSASTITTAQSLTVNVTVAGSGTLGTPTGTVTLSSGSYTSSGTTLTAGTATITIPGGSLAAGNDTLTVSYSGDSTYASTTATANIVVTAVSLLTPKVSITSASSSIDSSQALSLSVNVTGTGATPTGTVTVSGGGYTGTATSLSSGVASITIPANTFSSGTVTLTAIYGGDGNYAAGNGTTQITVTQSVYSVSTGTAPTAVSPGGTATTTMTIATSSSYSGTISLSCTQTGGPTNASGDAPSCTASPSSITLGGSSGNSATTTISIGTTAASAALQKPHIGNWLAGGGTALALLVFFGIPERRRKWRTFLGVFALLIAFGGFSACGGGGGSSGSSSGSGGGTTPSNPGTVAGNYTFTVTGTGSPSVSPAPTATITLTVN